LEIGRLDILHNVVQSPNLLISSPIPPLDTWEARWAAYDEPTYQDVLHHIRPDDIVLDIGAGDLRLARRMAAIAHHVFAIENQPILLAEQPPLPPNLTVICVDARTIPWPDSITLGVLLMRHCTHTGLYANRLRAVGCHRLVTNARWGLTLEQVDLGPRLPWSAVEIGWYACLCGQTGFVVGSPERLTPLQIEYVAEVEQCPACYRTLVENKLEV
jgi:hypothetical protein